MTCFYSIKDLDYSAVLKSVYFCTRPKNVVEIGIGLGFSLNCFVELSSPQVKIRAYDIFEDFDGNHASFEKTSKKFPSVSVQYGDFFKLHKLIDDRSLDILHIDVANNGEIYQFVFDNYLTKLTTTGIVILEGGSKTRDNMEWMKKYNKPPIAPILERNKIKFKILTLGEDPSITLIKQ